MGCEILDAVCVKFQFHKVQLKDKKRKQITFCLIIFQFHKVQLKVIELHNITYTSIISIP